MSYTPPTLKEISNEYASLLGFESKINDVSGCSFGPEFNLLNTIYDVVRDIMVAGRFEFLQYKDESIVLTDGTREYTWPSNIDYNSISKIFLLFNRTPAAANAYFTRELTFMPYDPFHSAFMDNYNESKAIPIYWTSYIQKLFLHPTPDNNGGTTVFSGSGLNDLSAGGSYLGSYTYLVKISTASTTDKFQWSNDGGVTWSAEISITGAAQTLELGGTVTFTATTGHNLGDYWNISFALGYSLRVHCKQLYDRASFVNATTFNIPLQHYQLIKYGVMARLDMNSRGYWISEFDKGMLNLRFAVKPKKIQTF